MNFILGSRGRLGRAITNCYSERDRVALERHVYESWGHDGASDAVARYFDGAGADESSVIYVASGLLDPRLSADDLRAVNFLLPRNVIEGASKLGCRVVTFGTVMEALLHQGNPYVQSKFELGNYVAAARSSRVVHMRMHTLYGGSAPSPFMFLGQMRTAILEKAPFAMTQGRQLREYHHIVDDACAVRTILEADLSGTIDISHGEAISLRDLAQHVFASLGVNHLLRIGALIEPREENHTHVFARPNVLNRVVFRETLPAVAEYMKEHSLERVRGNAHDAP